MSSYIKDLAPSLFNNIVCYLVTISITIHTVVENITPHIKHPIVESVKFDCAIIYANYLHIVNTK